MPLLPEWKIFCIRLQILRLFNGSIHREMSIMRAYLGESGVRTADYIGPNRRYGSERRITPDPRRVVRFDQNGGDRRSGFARRITDEGFREQDFPDC
jgi:hypothetical protein